MSFGLTILLCAFSAQSVAANNIWESTFGQRWFYEVRSWSGEVMAGTWWESSLQPGTTYNISFTVNNMRGKLGLLLGNDSAITIDRTGNYSFDFSVIQGGKRRMIFRALSHDAMAAVNQIQVTPKWSGASSSEGSSGGGNGSTGNWLPKGHYISFDRSRNLRIDMQNLIDQPSAAPNWYKLNMARQLDSALKTPGVKGIYMEYEWKSVEVGDGKYDWRLMDANMEVARKRGLKFIVKIADRSFNGKNLMPGYFPSQYVIWSSGGGHYGAVSKRWDPYVYNRIIRIYKAIANRYADHAGFGGIATAETAIGNFSGGNYSLNAYKTALTQIVTQTQAAMKRGRLFLYINFLKGGDNSDMNKDARVSLLNQVPHHNLSIGAPDITPDVPGMPRSATNYRLHARKNMPGLSQFCHLQNVDQGLHGTNVKTNKHRQKYYDEVAAARHRESQWWYKGSKGVFHFDDLRDPQGNQVKLHPNWVLGQMWKPHELVSFGARNFNCDYMFWHYREWPAKNEFTWNEIETTILNSQYFYKY